MQSESHKTIYYVIFGTQKILAFIFATLEEMQLVLYMDDFYLFLVFCLFLLLPSIYIVLKFACKEMESHCYICQIVGLHNGEEEESKVRIV